MEYEKARSYIDESHRFGGEVSLKAITGFLARLGNPQDDLQFIHIAGTNGKGSVGAYLASVLQEAGYKIGRFVSPTLYAYRERIQINGNYIAREDFGRLMDPIAGVIEEIKKNQEPLPSPFEIETALSFLYFREQKCDLVLLECGMGGLNDATNVIKNTQLAVITSISMDHMEYLGESIGEIARQKAGIIKPGATVVTCLQRPEAAAVISSVCREGRNLLAVGKAYDARVLKSDLEHMTFTYRGETWTIHLAGAHQLENAVLALTGIQALIDRGYEISVQQIKDGLEKTRWNGRFTVLRENPYFIVDGAHNPDAALKLKKSLDMYFPGKRKIFLMGVFKDKQYDKIAEILAPVADTVIAMETPDNPRALPAKQLAETVSSYNDRVLTAKSLEQAVELGFQTAKPEDVIVAFGSLSFIGDLTKIVSKEDNRKDI
ncbi:MAG: bifunctional folylpolyglutamate synthase/dihydrofolate synthase [Oliverpabstia sp.]|nr:bifunctional folylpolyglutamate synthase/dihydrofolate synthase [Eubacterium sp.]MDY2596792.1 folylpolyglutamate synthase/dihydrofolate synthase family protein [Oliverpabstia sp.]